LKTDPLGRSEAELGHNGFFRLRSTDHFADRATTDPALPNEPFTATKRPVSFTL
jgi:hypothetical protein